VANAARFDPGGNSFDPTASLEVPRALHTATTLNSGRVLLAGGSAFDDCEVTTVFATAVVFDPATSTYSAPLSMREARERHSATLLLDGTVLVIGQTAELFDPAAFSFVITGDPAASGVDRRATRLADGRVLLTGGTALAEIYE
jgi:hypothetical protein